MIVIFKNRILKMKNNLITRLNIIHKKSNIREITRIICYFILVLGLVTVNPTFAMEHGKTALDIAKSISEQNFQEAERLLTILRTAQLTEDQIRDLNEIINKSLQTHHVDQFGVNNLDIQNVDNPYHEPVSTRSVLIVLGIAVICTASIYLIYRYWGDIQDVFFDMGRRITPQVTRQVLLANYNIVRNNPNVVQEMGAYINLNHIVTDIPDNM